MKGCIRRKGVVHPMQIELKFSHITFITTGAHHEQTVG